MKHTKADRGTMHLPLIRQFITGDVPKNNYVSIPESPLYVDDEYGNRILRFGENGRGRLLNELYNVQESNQLTDDVKADLLIAIEAFSAFLGDIHVWYGPKSTKLLPNIEYKTFYAEQVVFFPDHNDPTFIEYRQQLAAYHNLQLHNQTIPSELLDYLNQAEYLLFYGPEREKARSAAIEQIVEKQMGLPIVQWCILAILYNPDELSALYVEAEKDEGQPAKSKRSKKIATPSSFRMSGHLVDQTLKYSYNVGVKTQPSLFDSLTTRTQQSLLAAGVDRETIVEGIQVTPAENKLIVSLSKLLHRKSQTEDPKSDDYYTGGKLPAEGRKPQYERYKDGSEKVPPEIVVTLHELTRECIGGKAPSGKEYDNVKATLQELSKKQFLINYKQTSPLDGGKKVEETIQEYQNLIKLRKYSRTVSDSKNVIESSTDEILISLHPIFRHSIASKFIVVPSDYLKRLAQAYGSSNISDATMRLANYLIREKCSNRPKAEIGLSRLHQLLCSKWVREGRRSKVIEFTDRAINTVVNLQLVTKYEVVSAKSTDGQKVVFYLNKNWPES